MLNINEFLEKLKQLNDEDKRNSVLEYCTDFISVLKKQEYTNEDKELIEKFVTEGLYKKIIDENISDAEIRKKILQIRHQYRWKLSGKDSELGKLYNDKNMFSTLSSRIERELDETITPENLDEHVKLLNNYVIDVVRSTCSRSLHEITRMQEHMSVDEFQKILSHKAIIKALEKDRNGTKRIDAEDKSNVQIYIYNYMDFLIVNNKELDFENDEFLKVLGTEEKENLKEYIQKKEHISRVIAGKDLPEKKEDMLEFCTDFVELLKKGYYSQRDKELIEKFVTEGLYKKIIDENISDAEIRKKILQIRQQYRWNLSKKDSELGKLYKGKNMFHILSSQIERELDETITPENLKEHVKMLNDYVIDIVHPTCSRSLHEITRMQEYMSVDEFQSLPAHKKIIVMIENDTKGTEKIPNGDMENVQQYISNYIDFLNSNGKDIDFENDEFLKVLKPEEKERVKEECRIKDILSNRNVDSVENKDLLIMLNMIRQVCSRKNIFDNEKKMLRNYIEKDFFEKTIRENFADKEIRDIVFKLRAEYRSGNMLEKDEDSFKIYDSKNIDKVIVEESIGYYTNLEDGYEITIQEIETINRIADRIINKSFEVHQFEPDEKRFIDMYFDKFFEKSIKNVDKRFAIEKTLESLIKTQRYFVYNSKPILNKHTAEIKSISDLLREKILPENSKDLDITQYDAILKLIAYQNVGNVSSLKIGMEELQKKGVTDIYNTSSVREYIEHFVQFYSPKGNDKITMPQKDEVFSFIYEYVNSLTQKKDFNLFKAQGISDILQLIEAKRLPKKCAKEISKIISSNLEIDKIDKDVVLKNATEFCEKRTREQLDGSKKVEPVTDEKEFDDFLENVQQLKLTNKLRVSDTIANFIIRQNFEENSVVRKNPKKYQEVIERTLEDIAFNDICTRMSQLNTRKRCFFIRNIVTSDSSDYNNACNNSAGYMRLSRHLVKSFIEKKNLKVFETIFHENTHTEQGYKNTKKNSYIRYLIDKEGIIRTENPEYYKANYKYMYCEIEARTEGARKLSRFVKKLGLDLTQDYVLEGLLKGDILAACKQRIKNERESFQKANDKVEKIGDTKTIKVTEYFDEIISRKPQILKNHHALRKEYNADGSLKTPLQFLTDAPSKIGRNNLLLYRNILSKGNIFKSANLERDLTDIMLVAKDSSVDKNLIAFTALDNIGRMVDEIVPQIDELPLERLVSLHEAFQKTNKYIEDKESTSFNLGIQKKPRGIEKSGYIKMNEANQKIQERLKEFSKEEILEVRKKLTEESNRKKENLEELKAEKINVDSKIAIIENKKKKEAPNEEMEIE